MSYTSLSPFYKWRQAAVPQSQEYYEDSVSYKDIKCFKEFLAHSKGLIKIWYYYDLQSVWSCLERPGCPAWPRGWFHMGTYVLRNPGSKGSKGFSVSQEMLLPDTPTRRGDEKVDVPRIKSWHLNLCSQIECEGSRTQFYKISIKSRMIFPHLERNKS